MTTSNKAAAVARSAAAPIVAKPRAEYQLFADQITERKQSLSAICFDAAIFARDNDATKEECAILKAVVSKQQWSDMGKIISCSHKLPKSAPTNLVKLAQYIRALDKGANAAQAKSHSEGKINAKELTAAINGETAPAPVAVDSEDSAPAGRAVNLPVHGGEGKTPFMLLDEALAALALEYGESKSKGIKAALALLQTTARQLSDAAAAE